MVDLFVELVMTGINSAHIHVLCELCVAQEFAWPIARAIEPDEQVEIQIYTYNKYLSNR